MRLGAPSLPGGGGGGAESNCAEILLINIDTLAVIELVFPLQTEPRGGATLEGA